MRSFAVKGVYTDLGVIVKRKEYVQREMGLGECGHRQIHTTQCTLYVPCPGRTRGVGILRVSVERGNGGALYSWEVGDRVKNVEVVLKQRGVDGAGDTAQ